MKINVYDKDKKKVLIESEGKNKTKIKNIENELNKQLDKILVEKETIENIKEKIKKVLEENGIKEYKIDFSNRLIKIISPDIALHDKGSFTKKIEAKNISLKIKEIFKK